MDLYYVLRFKKRWTSLTDYVDFCSVLHGLQIAEYSSNDSINDLGLEILKTTKEYPEISAPKITLQIQKYDSSITL